MIDFTGMTFAQLGALLTGGTRIAVTAKNPVEDWEGYVEAGMRMEVTKYRRPPNDDLAYITVDYTKYDEFNKALESANYYDKKANPCLTAREHGSYKVTEEYCIMADGRVSDCFLPLESAGAVLLAEYQATGKEAGSYVGWLEAQLLIARDSTIDRAGLLARFN